MLGLLGFSLIAGLPLLAVSGLRHRLQARLQIMREALGGAPPAKSVVARIGENSKPFPKEFERKIEPIPQAKGGVLVLPGQTYNPLAVYQAPPPRRSTTTAPSAGPRPSRKLSIPIIREVPEEPVQKAETPEKAEPASSEPEFRKGQPEQEAYDMLLQLSATVAGMVKGANPPFRFKDWAAAKMEDESYWVRLVFLKDGAEAAYIWQVKPQSKQVTPLNFNARSLPKS